MTTNMSIDEMLMTIAEGQSNYTWQKLICFYGKRIGEMPAIKLNRRFSRTIGRAHFEEGIITLSTKVFQAYPRAVSEIIIPHEQAHFVAWRLFKDYGHQRPWKDVMIKLGLPPTATIDVEKY